MKNLVILVSLSLSIGFAIALAEAEEPVLTWENSDSSTFSAFAEID